jgi:hypothetical protein
MVGAGARVGDATEVGGVPHEGTRNESETVELRQPTNSSTQPPREEELDEVLLGPLLERLPEVGLYELHACG